MKTRNLAGLAFLASVEFLSGCVSERINVQNSDKKLTPICAITETPKTFIGSRVVVNARYVSDGSTYTYLRDPRCSGDRLLDISNLASKGDESVKAFRKARKDACVAKRSLLLCTLEADIVAEVTVVAGRDGLVAVDLEKVIDYRIRR